MKSGIVLVCLCFFDVIYLIKAHDLPDLTDTKPDVFPYHAVVHGRMVCGGILITNEYLITPAYCVYGSSDVTVYLGFCGYPYFSSHHTEPNTQIYHCNDITIHEDFVKINDQHYLNNIALIKLPSPVKTNNVIRPGKLMSREDSNLLEGTFANVSGWLVSKDEDIKFATVQLRDEDTCGFLFGHEFLRSQELCVKWFTKTRLNLLGNAVQVNDKIIGFQTNTPHCHKSSSSCTRNDMVLKFAPYLDWLSHKMGIPVDHFTTKSQKCCDNNDVRLKLAQLAKRFDEYIAKEQIIFERYDIQFANLNAQVINTSVEIQNIRNEQNKFVLSLNEQIGDLRTQINNNRSRNDESLLKLQEELNGVRTELSNGLTAQRSLADLESRIEALNSSVRNQGDERVIKLEANFKELLNKTIALQFLENLHFQQLNQEITNLHDRIIEVDEREEKHEAQLHKEFNYINATLIDLSHTQHKLHHSIEEINNSAEGYASNVKAALFKLQQQIDEIVAYAHENVHKKSIHFDEIEKLFGEQRSDFDKHIIQEHSQIHSLWAEIKSLNATVHWIKDFIHEDPYSN